MCRRSAITIIKLVSLILSLTFVDCDLGVAQTDILSRLAQDGRFSEIIGISLAQIAGQGCNSPCQVTAFKNIARASLLLGDYEGAEYYLELSQTKGAIDLAVDKLLAYQAILLSNHERVNALVKKITTVNPEEGLKLNLLATVDGPERNSQDSIRKTAELLVQSKPPFSHEFIAEYSQGNARSALAAGLFSAAFPGAGHAYLGMWESAAVSFFLVGVCAVATSELIHDGHYGTATAAGLIGSVFYIGGIFSAARSANEISDRNFQTSREKIRAWTLPELKFQWQRDL